MWSPPGLWKLPLPKLIWRKTLALSLVATAFTEVKDFKSFATLLAPPLHHRRMLFGAVATAGRSATLRKSSTSFTDRFPAAYHHHPLDYVPICRYGVLSPEEDVVSRRRRELHAGDVEEEEGGWGSKQGQDLFSYCSCPNCLTATP